MGMAAILVKWPWPFEHKFVPHVPRRLYMKFGFYRTNGFRGEDVWKCWQHTYMHTNGRQRPTYTISSPMSLKAQVNLKRKNGIILWKIKLNLAFAIRFVSSMLNRSARLNHFVLIMNYPTKERPQYHVKQASRFDKRIWNTSNGKITALRNSSVKRFFLLLLLHKTSVVITQNSLGRRWRDLQTANVLYTSFGINTCQKAETKSRT